MQSDFFSEKTAKRYYPLPLPFQSPVLLESGVVDNTEQTNLIW